MESERDLNQPPKPPIADTPSANQYLGSISDEHVRLIDEQIVKHFNSHEDLREFLHQIEIRNSDDNFKILKVTCTSVEASLNLMLAEWFVSGFNRATHWFFILIDIQGAFEDINTDDLRSLQSLRSSSKPLVIQWTSRNTNKHCVFYKPSNETELIPLNQVMEVELTEEELIEELTPEGSFSLPLLLKALSHGLGGFFTGDLSKIAFDVEREFDGWRLLDYAARDDDVLSLRLLKLVEWDLTAISGEQRVLEIAAKYSSPQSISALLDQPIIGTEVEPSLSISQKDLLKLVDVSNNTPLTIAIEEGRVDTMEYLILCGADVNHRKKMQWNYLSPIQLAWNSKFYDKVLVLLEADSPFPNEYHLDDLDDSDIIVKLKELTDIRRKFHENIIDKDEDKVNDFIRDYPQLKHAYNYDNQTALVTALKSKAYEMFALLESKKFLASKSEDLAALKERLSEQENNELKEAKHRYFGRVKDAHIMNLLSKWRTHGVENEDRSVLVRDLFERLDQIPEVSTVLKVVEHAEALEIIFDFNNDSIVDLDPTQAESTSGSCDYKMGRLYVGAKQPLEALGTLAHELTHLAMQTVFDNDCNPYTTSDEDTKSSFGEIVEKYRNLEGLDPIIARVFTAYKNYPKQWPSELIVRVPHILATHHKHKDDHQMLENLRKGALELFSFYSKNVQKQFEEFIKNPGRFKAQIKLRRLNDLLGQLQAIEESKIRLQSPSLFKDNEIDFNTISVLSSDLPQLTKSDLYQTLKRKEGNLQDKYIFTGIDQFKNDKQAGEIYDAFQSPIKPILIVDCSRDYDLHNFYLWETICSFREKRRIILMVDLEIGSSVRNKLNKFQMTLIEKQYKWIDLEVESQNLLLEHSMDFQGYPIALNRLIQHNVSPMKSIPLQDLLQGLQIKIGKPLHLSYDYDENYYVERIFNRYVTIKNDIISDEANRKFTDFLTFSQEEFDILRQQHPNSNIHWLHRDSSQNLIWKRSQGSLERLRKYIDTSKPNLYAPNNLNDLLNVADDRKIMIISDTAGMGKSTVLTHLSKCIKNLFPAYWVVKFDLSENTDKLEEQGKTKIGALQFLSEKILDFDSEFEAKVFAELLADKRVILMLDSFDEISPVYKEIVIDLLQDLQQINIRHLWIATRPHLKENLEDVLMEFSYSLESFSLENQIEFLTKFWKVTLGISAIHIAVKVEIYGKLLIERLMESINDKDKAFTGVPLQTRMLAEAFGEDFKEFVESNEAEPNLPKKLDLLEVYERFLDRKYLIYVSEKNNPTKLNVATKDLVSILKGGVNLRKIHQQLALEVLFPNQKETLLARLKSHSLPPEKLNRIGLVQYSSNRPHFIHRTFAEYYAADFFVYQMSKTTIHNPEVQDILLNQVLLMPDHQVVRAFIDGLLIGSPPIEKVLQLYGNRIEEIWKEIQVEQGSPLKRYQTLMQQPLRYWEGSSKDEVKILRATVPHLELKRMEEQIRDTWTKSTGGNDGTGGTILHQNVQEFNVSILNFLLSSLRLSRHLVTMKKLFFYPDNKGQTICYGTAVIGSFKLFRKLLEFIKEIRLDQKELMDLLLAADKDKRTTWHWVAFNNSLDILRAIWSLLEDKSTLLTIRDKYGRTIFHWTAQYATVDFLNGLRELANEINFDILSMLSMKDVDTGNVWHYSTHNPDLRMLASIWNLAKETGSNLEELLLTQDNSRQTAWHWSILNSNGFVVKKLWELSKDAGLDIKNLLLDKNKYSQSAWELCLSRSKPEILEMLWGFALEAGVDRQNDLLMSKTKDDENIWHMVVKNGHAESLDKLWQFNKEILTIDEIKKLLLHRQAFGQTPWAHAVRNNSIDRLEKLWAWIRGLGLNPDELRTELVASDIYKQTSWHWGVSNGYPGVLVKLWELYQSIEPQIPSDASVLLVKDTSGRTAFEWAVELNVNATQQFWELIRDVNVDQKRAIFISKNCTGNSIWHTAPINGKVDLMAKLLDFAKEIDVYSKEEILLVKNDKGKTPWSITTIHGKPHFIEYVWELAKTLGADLKMLLLSTDQNKQSSWHWIIENTNPESMDLLWSFTKEVLNPEEWKTPFFLKDRFGNTPWSLAVKNDSNERVVKLWKLIKGVQSNAEELVEMLLFKAEEDRTPWHWIAVNGNLELLGILEKFLGEIGYMESFYGLINDLDEGNRSALKYAVTEEYFEVAVALIRRGAITESLNKEEMESLQQYTTKNQCTTHGSSSIDSGEIIDDTCAYALLALPTQV